MGVLHKRHLCTSCGKSDLITEVNKTLQSLIDISSCFSQYDDRQLNLQLRFLKQLFNLDAYKQSLNRTKSGRDTVLFSSLHKLTLSLLEQMDGYLKNLSSETTRSMSKTMHELQTHIDRIVHKSGYAEVCISSLFAQFYFNA